MLVHAVEASLCLAASGARTVIVPCLGWTEDPEVDVEVVVDGHRSGRVVELASVVWAREERYKASVGEEFVAVLDHL